jgi:hypothetical protein
LKPILSDEGLGLIAFAGGDVAEAHYFCYRHLIEKFGSNGLLGMMAARILHIPTPADFMRAHEQVLIEVDLLLERERISQSDHDRFVTFIGGRTGTEYKHGIWERAAKGISTCSNHAERFHRTVNKRVRHIEILPHRLSILVDVINEKFDKYQSENHRQLRYVIKGLRAKQALHPGLRDPHCARPKCVHFRRMMADRFGLSSFPCKHTAIKERYSAMSPEVPTLQEGTFELDVQDIGEAIEWPFRTRTKVPKAAPLDLRMIPKYSDDDRGFILRIVKEVTFLLKPNQRPHGDAKYSLVLEVAQALFDCQGREAGRSQSDFRAVFAVEAWTWATNRATEKDLVTGFYTYMVSGPVEGT